MFKWVIAVLFSQWAALTPHNDRNNGHSAAVLLSCISNDGWECVVAAADLLHCFRGHGNIRRFSSIPMIDLLFGVKLATCVICEALRVCVASGVWL